MGVRSDSDKGKSIGTILAGVAGVCALLAFAVFTDWVDDSGVLNTRLYGSSKGYCFLLEITGWLCCVAAVLLFQSAAAAMNSSIVGDDAKPKLKISALVMTVLALVLFIAAVAVPDWSVDDNSKDDSATLAGVNWGLFQYCVKLPGADNTCAVIDAKRCEYTPDFGINPAVTFTMPECQRFQVVRAFALLAVLIGLVPLITIILNVKGNEKMLMIAFVSSILTCLCGLVAMASFADYFSRNIENNNRVGDGTLKLGVGMYLEAAGWTLSGLSALMLFLVM